MHPLPKIVFIPFLFGLCLPISAFAGSVTKLIDEGQTVELKVPVRIGFGTLMEFPEPISSAVLADKSLFACQRFPMRIVCSVAGETGNSSNLIIATNKNNYILTLVSTNESGYDSVFFRYKALSSATKSSQSSDPFIEAFLKYFVVNKLNRADQNDVLRFSVSKMVQLGNRFFTLFSVENLSEETVRITSVELSIITHGYLTGLPVKQTKMYGTTFNLQRGTLAPQEKTDGVISARQPHLLDTQELSVQLMAEGSRRYEISIGRIKL